MEGVKTIKLDIITPDGQPYSGDVRFVLARAIDGDIGIYPNHAPMVVALDTDAFKYIDAEGETHYLALFGCTLEVLDNQITVLTRNCEEAVSIDKARALRAKERAEKRLAEKGNPDIDYERASAALKRAMTRIRVVEFVK